ncbi:transposase [Jeotgalibacillus salarius]|uniref:Transposase n=1 Tax=Jeotgalibacillus salarius TaxID=546023 RepID=A0A4Y8LN49_9BACL|nr:transposase [Jeotgalibacillus salarius]TFE04010.1 transposase [Jeotgalibacillus salarius]
MPRESRKISQSGIYHVHSKGSNYQMIFYDDHDRNKFLMKLHSVKQVTEFELYGWCLMDNHFHLIIKVKEVPISRIMQKLNGSYAIYFNAKYQAIGSLYYDRFKSHEVENLQYLFTLIRYVHHNPVRAHMVQTPSAWHWSSCRDYYGYSTPHSHLLNHHKILQTFSSNPEQAIYRFTTFNESPADKPRHLLTKKPVFTDQEAIKEIQNHIIDPPIHVIKYLPPTERKIVIRHLKTIKGISLRQLARILGTSLGVVRRA